MDTELTLMRSNVNKVLFSNDDVKCPAGHKCNKTKQTGVYFC